MNMMKQYTFYPNQGQQILARILLTIWLPVMCSPEITLANPQSESSVPEAPANWFLGPLPSEGSDQGDWTYVQKIPEDTKVIQWLSNSGVPQGDHQEALNVAAAQGEVAQVEHILTTQDININAVDDQGRSALHQAVMAGHKETAALLIRYRADVALKDYQENKTPFDYADQEDDRRYLSTIAVLVQLFLTLDNLIEDGIIKNQDEIDQKLEQVCSRLRKLEIKGIQDDEQYRYFKYRYHIQQANYISALGYEAGASQQEKLAKKFQPLPPQSLDADEQQELEAQIASGTEETCATDDAIVHIQKLLKGISDQGILPENTCNQLKNFVATAQEVPRNFPSYCHISTAREAFTVQIAEGLQQCNDSSQNPENNKLKPQIEQVKELLAALETAVINAIDVNKITFIKNTLALPEKTMDTFFSNFFSVTENDVNSRYGTLTSHFDPTKAKWIPEAYHEDAQALMSLITFCRDELLENRISAARYQSGGDSAWRKFKDYEYGQQGQWDQLTILKRGDLESLTSDQIDASKIKHAKAAYQYYRAGSRKVAKDDLKSQIQFRNSMALCLAALGKPLAAHLYALAAVNLAENDSEDQTKAKKILDQIKAGTPWHHGRGAATREPLDEGDEALAYLERLAGNIIFKSDQGLVSYQASKEEIVQAKKQADRYGFAASASGVGGSIGSIASMVGVGALEETIVAAGMMFGPFVMLAFVPFGVGIFGIMYLDSRREKLQKEINIRQALHSMIAQAIECYKQGKMQEFLNKLSSAYDKNERLLSLEEIGTSSARDKIIGLLASGIRPDGIAYLFNTIGEALNSNSDSTPVSIPGWKPDELPILARKSFEGTLNEKLAEAAKNLDASVSEIRRQIEEKAPWFHKLSDFSQPQQKYLAPEHRTAAQEMPFSARLDSVRNAAKLNIALIELASMEKGNIEEMRSLAKVVQESIDKYGPFNTVIEKQLKAIKEIVWILSGQSVDSAPNVTNAAAPDLPPSEEVTGDAYLDQLNEKLKQLDEKLKQAKLPEERLKIYNQKAATYIKKAKVIHSESESLQNWQLAEKNYTRAMQLRKYDLTAYLGYAQCLIELSKYNRAVRYLKKHPQIKGTSALWIMTSRAYSKQGDSTKAKECILEALQLDPQSQEALDEKKFIEKLQHVEHSNTAPPKFSPLSKIS